MAKQPKATFVLKKPAVGPALIAADSKVTRGQTMIALMREEGGATAKTLADAVGWQIHSVRGFIAGTLRKRADLAVTTTRTETGMRYSVADSQTLAPEAQG